jgi:integral membrane protein (TIGR00529 family)
MWDLLKLALILGVTIYLLTRKWDLGLILLIDSLLVGVLYLYPPLELLRSIWRGLVAVQTLKLCGAVFLVLVLAELLRRTASMLKMVNALQVLVPDGRIVLAIIPAVIGMMPMIGGAMFSAPMVDGLGTRLKASPWRKTFVNYWFRHSMEYVFPLYQSLLLVSAILGISVYTFIGASYPLTLAMVAGGVLWGLVGLTRPERESVDGRRRAAWRNLAVGTWPLLLVILLVVVLQIDILVGLGAVCALLMAVKRIGPRQWWDVLKRSVPLKTFSAILGVMAFKQVMEDSGAVQTIPAALAALGLPNLLVAFFVPFLIGLLTGTPPAAMALGVPVVAPLLDTPHIDLVAGGVWMFVGCFGGILLSPLHLCLALTREYFGAEWGEMYKRIVPSVALVIAVAGLIVWLR